ncbi:MAG: hypothetical protein K2X93_13865 [Candidatus Obscuribacterales bacterium]|nr:hypothetical protein [Candidatus Obscuribacterales bacterium]
MRFLVDVVSSVSRWLQSYLEEEVQTSNTQANTSNRGRGGAMAARRPNRNRPAATHASEAANFERLIQRAQAGMDEQDYRLSIMNVLLRTPHRDVAPYIPLFTDVHQRDPLFFIRLGAWYYDNGTVHDLKQLFIAFLATSKFSDEFRDAGLALLEKLPPYQVERVTRMIKGYRQGETFVEGLGSVPRSYKTAVENYLRQREADPASFDSAVLHARKPLKTLYASLRIKPGPYAQKVLFENDPPEGSRLAVLKQLAKTNDPTEQARLIVENKLPYRTAVSTIKTVTPAVLVALINAMTPQEVINNLSSLKARGAMDNADLRLMIETKLEAAKTDKRVSALKTREAIKVAGLDADMSEKVASVGDVQIKAKGKISRPIALLVDKSGSMTEAIELGKMIASIVAPICEKDLFVYAFDTMAYRVKAKGNDLSDWEKAFKGINAGGGTSCGVAIDNMTKSGAYVEQIIMVSDQEENTPPLMIPALRSYEHKMGVLPDVLFVNVGASYRPYLYDKMTAEGIMADNYVFTGDYYSLPSLIPLISGGTRLDLLSDIMNHPIPERKTPALVNSK